MVQAILPDGDWKGPLAARCGTVVGAGAVTVTVGGGVTVTVAVGADGGVGAAGGDDDDVNGDIVGVADGAWAEPADDAHPATVIAASATSHT